MLRRALPRVHLAARIGLGPVSGKPALAPRHCECEPERKRARTQPAPVARALQVTCGEGVMRKMVTCVNQQDQVRVQRGCLAALTAPDIHRVVASGIADSQEVSAARCIEIGEMAGQQPDPPSAPRILPPSLRMRARVRARSPSGEHNGLPPGGVHCAVLASHLHAAPSATAPAIRATTSTARGPECLHVSRPSCMHPERASHRRSQHALSIRSE
jgi:hypothetical protein